MINKHDGGRSRRSEMRREEEDDVRLANCGVIALTTTRTGFLQWKAN